MKRIAVGLEIGKFCCQLQRTFFFVWCNIHLHRGEWFSSDCVSNWNGEGWMKGRSHDEDDGLIRIQNYTKSMIFSIISTIHSICVLCSVPCALVHLLSDFFFDNFHLHSKYWCSIIGKIALQCHSRSCNSFAFIIFMRYLRVQKNPSKMYEILIKSLVLACAMHIWRTISITYGAHLHRLLLFKAPHIPSI